MEGGPWDPDDGISEDSSFVKASIRCRCSGVKSLVRP